jgi:hypothetical protein
MTAPTEQLVQIAHRGQEAVTTAVRTWNDALQAYAGAVTGHEPQLPDLHAAVDAAFDFAARVLADQREYTKALVAVGTQALEAVTEQATHAASALADATRNQPDAPSTAIVPVTPAPVVTVEDTPKRGRAPRDAGSN